MNLGKLLRAVPGSQEALWRCWQLPSLILNFSQKGSFFPLSGPVSPISSRGIILDSSLRNYPRQTPCSCLDGGTFSSFLSPLKRGSPSPNPSGASTLPGPQCQLQEWGPGQVCVQAGRRQKGRPVPCPILSFIQECAVWTPRQAKRLTITWSHSSTLLSSQACKGDPTTMPLLVMHPAPWLPCCYPPAARSPPC